MKLSPIFKIREEATPELVELLESVTLGTNGAHYRHLDTRVRIHSADQPLHLSLERNMRVLGNVTFCRRESAWYVRYFAFDKIFQAAGRQKSKGKSGRLKKELQYFFEQVIGPEQPFGKVDSFYAYIDPNNEKSLWMSENFGFETKAIIATQTYSRSKLAKQTKVEKVNDWHQVKDIMRNEFENYSYYFEHHLQQGPFYVLKNTAGEIIACAKATRATWAIERLPGKAGGWLPKVIPFIPGLRKIIRPKKHSFLVPEAVVVRNHNPETLELLLEGMLLLEKEHLHLWWTDEKSPLYSAVKDTVKWGVLHNLVGVNKAHLVVKCNENFNLDNSYPVYTCGFDFV